MAKERTLDLGFGKGGTYMRERRGVRIGLDYDISTLQLADQKPGLFLLQADAETSDYKKLPFASSTFDHVDIILPHDELLYALVENNTNLWSELQRVTKSRADLRIVVDAPSFGQQGIYVHGEPMIITLPQIQIIDGARNNGFQITDFGKMAQSDIQKIGTQFSQYLNGADFYQILASK
jgi:hypothetical protein